MTAKPGMAESDPEIGDNQVVKRYRSKAVRDFEVLRAIESLVRLEGFSPTFREISLAIDYAGLSQSHAAVAALVERGYLRRKPGRARTIALVKGRNSQQLAVDVGLELAHQVRLRRKLMKNPESTAGVGGEVPLPPADS